MEYIYKLITLIGSDNNMEVVPIDRSPSQDEIFGFDLKEIEAQAATLSYEEADLLTSGEQSEVKSLVEKKGLQKLDSFLNEAFDGYLTDMFFVPLPTQPNN